MFKLGSRCPEAFKILSYVPFKGGSRPPHAVRMHLLFGWQNLSAPLFLDGPFTSR